MSNCLTTQPISRPLAATIGFFDGVHLGHRSLIRELQALAAERGEATAVITFDRHPREVVNPSWQPQLLCSRKEAARRLTGTGIDMLVTLRFDSDMAALSARDFMRQVLCGRLGVKTLLMGYDNHFGHRTPGSTEGFEDYRSYGAGMGIDVICGHPLIVGGEPVSSSRVRRLIASGDVAGATRCLGHPYVLEGIVVGGEQKGRQMGFPTANIATESQRLVPADGVYATTAIIEGKSYAAMTNIGHRPTFGQHARTIETHILDFSADIYGKELAIAFSHRLRDEQSFDSPEALARQMQADAEQARHILTIDN